MPKIEVFDPPLCCETGICGAQVDPVLVRFAGELDDLKKQGWEVARYNPVHTPDAFTVRFNLDQVLNVQLGTSPTSVPEVRNLDAMNIDPEAAAAANRIVP